MVPAVACPFEDSLRTCPHGTQSSFTRHEGCRSIIICDTSRIEGAKEPKGNLDSILGPLPSTTKPGTPETTPESQSTDKPKTPLSDWEILQTYMEKVIDVSLKYQPTVEDSFRIAFAKFESPDQFCLERLLESAKVMGVTNIRILKQARVALTKLAHLADGEADAVRFTFILHIFELACLARMYPTEINVKKMPSGMEVETHANFRKVLDDTISPYGKALIAIRFSNRPYDPSIGAFLNNDIIEESAIREAIASCRNEIEQQQRAAAMRVPWDKLWNNFQADDAEISGAFHAVYNRFGSGLGLRELNTMSIGLRMIGEDAPNSWLEKWFEEETPRLSAKEFGELFEHDNLNLGGGGFVTKEVMARLQKVQAQRYNTETDFLKIAAKLYAREGWSHLDMAVMGNVTQDQLRKWITTSNDKDLTHTLKSLMNHPARDEPYQTFRKNLGEILTEIAAGPSKANKVRVNNIWVKEPEPQPELGSEPEPIPESETEPEPPKEGPTK